MSDEEAPDDWFRVGTVAPDNAGPMFETATTTSSTWSFPSRTVIWGAGGITVAHGSGYFLAPEPDEVEISVEDWKIIDGAIIESVARGHARRL